MPMKGRWGIVGGGFLGMTLARRLAQHGQDVTLFEAAPALGGLASAWSLGDVVWDRHYHVTLLSDAYLRALLTELGLEQEMAWVETRTGFYTDGTLYSMSNTLEFLRFPPLSLFSKLRLGATILYASRLRDWKKLEKILVADWLKRWSGRATFEKIWLPLLRAATKIESTAEGVAIDFAGGSRRTFDQVVVTLAAPLAARLCPGLSSDELARLEGIQYQGVMCASFLLKRPLADFYVTNITDRWVPFTAVIEMSALVDRAHFGGRALVYLPKYLKPDDPAFSHSDREVQDMFLDGLARMYPHFRRADVECFRVSRVKHVLAISTLGYSDRLPPMTTSLPGLHIVNSAHIVNGTLNVNETVQLAEKAAARLLSPVRVASVASEDEQLVARA